MKSCGFGRTSPNWKGAAMVSDYEEIEHVYEDGSDEGDNARCHYCGGQGWGFVGTDWDTDDAINGPFDGEMEKCPCCGGSGHAEDCVFW
jgi:hypothetical protein